MSDKPSRDGRAAFYATILPKVIEAARGCGYAIGVHGSLQTDLDLIAAPWVEEAKSDEELADTIATACHAIVSRGGARFVDGKWVPAETPGVNPHGRRVWTIGLMGSIYIDLSVMPRLTPGGPSS